jgi:hypothetical protein
MFCAALCPVLAGCASSYSLGPYLDKSGGQRPSDIKFPQLNHQKLMSDDGSRTVVEYSIDVMWHCRWIFEIEKAWRYPDAEAAKYCQQLPSSLP